METSKLQDIKNKYNLVGNSASLNHAIEMAVGVAPTDLTVLVEGESGVGKDSIPRIIHQHSLRKTGKYLAVNCAAIPEGTVDSELFGHEKGSFTGAYEARKGYFEEADGGTLFLDEIGELPLPTQAKLLRVLQSGEYIRVGSSKVAKTNVRVIAATNANLSYAVSKGKFRADLFYRLGAITINMPPLRERPEDIHLLFRKFTSDFSEQYSRRKVVLTRDAVEMLTKYRWPGNIRQLQSVAYRVSVYETDAVAPGSERCEINAAILSKYMPDDSDGNLPVLAGERRSSISDDDRQDIYRALYSLSEEVANLKKIVLATGAQAAPMELPEATSGVSRPDSYITRAPEGSWDKADVDVQDGGWSDDSTPVSIKGASDELIRKALERNGGNRKKAAAELGISERTLYRKIKK